MTDLERKFRAQFSPKYCEYCGSAATCLARAAFWSCDEHKHTEGVKQFDWTTGFSLMATNHITGNGNTLDLHRALTDEQLEEQIDYWEERRSASEGRDAWGYSKLLSTAVMVKKERVSPHG